MTLTEDIQNLFSSEWEGLNQVMESVLDTRSNLLNKINRYLLGNSGKRLRPLLAIVTAKACSGSVNSQVVACAATAELIHTATLLHDDVVDESDYRRGQLTVRKLLSPGASILIGDYWLTRAIHLLVSNNCPYNVISLFSRALEQLAEGEVMQMELAESLKTGENDYLDVISRKTASLFVAAVKSAALVSGATEEETQAVEEYARLLGVSFQIRDDLIDYRPSSETGKDSQSDIMERKITLPLLCAMRNAPEKEEYIRNRMSQISGLPDRSQEDTLIAHEVKEFVLTEGGIESAKAILEDYIDRAKACLSVIKPSASKDCLLSIASYVSTV